MFSSSAYIAIPLAVAVAALCSCLPPAQAAAAAPLVATFTSQTKGHIFADTHGELILHIADNDPVTGGTIISKNERGQVIAEQKIDAAQSEIPVPLKEKGFYEVEATVTLASGQTARAETTAAVIGPLLNEAVRGQSRLGLWTVQGDPDLVLAAGARWNRTMTSLKDYPEAFLRDEEPKPSTPVKPPSDLRGFTYTGVISFGLPLWLLDTLPVDPPKGISKPFQAPKDWNALSELVKAFVRKHPRWSDFPPYFEGYNEPEWAWKGSKEDLVRFQKTVADAIKEMRPDVKVLGPCFSSIRIKDPARLDLETVNRLGLFEHLDGMVLHAYVDGSAPEDLFIQRIQEVQSFLARIGRPDFPLHITEFGWCTKPGTWQRPVDELVQAQYVVRSLTLLDALGVENSTYFCLLFKAAPNEGERSFSIIHNDLTPKPAYATFANVARWLADVQGKGHWLRLTPSTHMVIFHKSKKDIAVVWDTATTRTISLPGTVSHAEEMTGRPLSIGARNTLAISPSPVFLELENGALYQAESKPPLRLMRGNSLAIPASADTQWLTPAPLRVEKNRVEAPQDAPKGSYLLLSQAGQKWTTLPLEVITPLEVAPVCIEWPPSEAAPHLSTSVQSHAASPVIATASAKLEKKRTVFSDPNEIPPGSGAKLTTPLEDFVLGKRYRGTFAVESRENGRRDRMEQPLDLTVVAAQPVTKQATPDWNAIPPVDFSDWDPFGGLSEKANCSATFQAAHDTRALYLRICVRDDSHLQTSSPEKLWSQDSIQLGFDVDTEKTWEANDLFALKGHRVFEYGVAWNGKETMNWRWISYLPELPVGQSESRLNVQVHRQDDITEYIITFPWDILGLKEAPKSGSAIGIALAVTDVDPGKKDRRGLRLFGGITDGKAPEKFGKLWLR
ncbi:MAG: sugar-binding protein [Chthoniobacteraceae bacterium]